MGTLCLALVLTILQTIPGANAVAAIPGPDGSWALVHGSALWICWRHRPGQTCFTRVFGPATNLQRGRFFGPDTFVVSSSTSAFLLRRNDTVATELGERERADLVDLPRLTGVDCAPAGWLPQLGPHGPKWMWLPCEVHRFVSCRAPPPPRLRRPSPVLLSLTIGLRWSSTKPMAGKQRALSFDIGLGFGLRGRINPAIARARLRRREHLDFPLHTIHPALQQLEAAALRRAVCPQD